MKIIEGFQGTTEWHEDHLGKASASRVEDIERKSRTKGERSAAWQDYRGDKIAEILSGRPLPPGFVSFAMQRGLDLEPLARQAYEAQESVSVRQVRFAVHETIDRFGCSPDGLVGDDGMIQIKCPKISSHLNYFFTDEIEPEYLTQMHAELAVCDGRMWNDFVSFCPDLPEELQLYTKRIHRDDGRVSEIESSVRLFIEDIDAHIDLLQTKRLFTIPALTAQKEF